MKFVKQNYRPPFGTEGNNRKRRNIPWYGIFFSLFLGWGFSAVGINEVYFETQESKYYNQAIEIYNRGSDSVDLSRFTLIAGKWESNAFVGSRTNEIKTWSASKQTDFSSSFTSLSFSPLLPSGGVAVILDSGYRLEEKFAFTNIARSNTLYLLTVSTGVLGTGAFLKDDDVLRLVEDGGQPGETVIDEFHNRTTSTGYSVVKIDPDKKGLPDNTTSRFQTIGYFEELSDLYATLPGDHLRLDEVNGNPTVVGLPQVYDLTCRYLTAVSQLCNPTIRFHRHDYIKMYHYPKDSANLITSSDDIVFTSGQSDPITLFALEPGLHRISTADNSFPSLERTVLDFDHSQAENVFITEIYYDSDKNLTWMEIYTRVSQTLPLRLQTFNSEYRQNNEFDLGMVTLSPGYHVLGYRNDDFNQQFPLSDPVIPLPAQFSITTKGVLSLSSTNRYLDIVHYDKNWYSDLIEGRSLQRNIIEKYAFVKERWSVSTEVDSTPFSANIFTRSLTFSIDLPRRISLSSVRIEFLADFNTEGELTAYLYDPRGYRIGKVFSQEVSRSYRIPLFLCLKEVKKRYGLITGEYSLMFLFKNSEGKKTLYRNFIIE